MCSRSFKSEQDGAVRCSVFFFFQLRIIVFLLLLQWICVFFKIMGSLGLLLGYVRVDIAMEMVGYYNLEKCWWFKRRAETQRPCWDDGWTALISPPSWMLQSRNHKCLLMSWQWLQLEILEEGLLSSRNIMNQNFQWIHPSNTSLVLGCFPACVSLPVNERQTGPAPLPSRHQSLHSPANRLSS